MRLHTKDSKSITLPIELRAEFSTDHVRISDVAISLLTLLTGSSFHALISQAVYRVINSRPILSGGFFYSISAAVIDIGYLLAVVSPWLFIQSGFFFSHSKTTIICNLH